MKLLALGLVLLSGTAFAEVPEIVAKKVTCSELQAELQQYGSIIVVKKTLFFKKKVQVNTEADCSGSYEYKVSPTFKTRDDKDCAVGHYCEYSSPTDYSGSYSSGSYSSGSYSSGYGSDYSSGSSYSGSSSSSSSGSNYNPPSSSDHGSNYNPPSSGTHGSRYCPTCAQ